MEVNYLNENRKAIDCMIQHLKTFHKQSENGVLADFGEPCLECEYNKKCNYNWLSTMSPLLEQSTIKIKLARSEN